SYAQVFDRGYITYDAKGRPHRMIGAVADMTTRRRLEEQLVRSQKMEVLGQLSSGLAHDFNNLLTIIQCNAYLVGENADEVVGAYVKDILHATERATSLTRQLLLLGRKQRLRETTVDLNRFVEDMMQILHRTLTAKISVKAAIDETLPAIRADASMLEQVLLNLVLNARDAMEGAGTITISTSQVVVESAVVRHGFVAEPGLYACLSVQDTGTGISSEALPQIFEAFYTTKEIGRGTGLGLSTVYHIVKQHRGWLDVSSMLGAGTTFVIALPATEGARADEAPTFASNDMPSGTETLLLIEDEPLLRDRLGRVLRNYGYNVIECESGPGALEAWREHAARIDLVLSDIVMPGGLDGRQVVQLLRRDRPELCVIYSSGFSPEHAGHGEQLVDGVNFLEKPYAPSTLLQLIRQQLDRRPR
ncbi:MAG: response regulator, partial [Deltaproteobacteria bacterium]|nr:response regulator [Deltaproteobacteria bacterium]